MLSVLVRRMQHDMDGKALDTHKVARGLTAVTFDGASPAMTWRLQGEDAADPVRGPLNTGGLYGERSAGICRGTGTRAGPSSASRVPSGGGRG